MTPSQVLEISKYCILMLLYVSWPVLLSALIVGLLVSIFQALTQLQEQTLSFVPKIIAVILSIMVSMHYIGSYMFIFFEHIIFIITNLE